MKRKDLEQLRGLQLEIEHLEEKADKPGRTWQVDYYKDYRFNPKGVVKSIEGYDDGQSEAKRLEAKIHKLKVEKINKLSELEDFIESVDDATMRTILRMYYRDGYSQKEIGDQLGFERVSIAQKIKRFWDEKRYT